MRAGSSRSRPKPSFTENDVVVLARRGHFRFESGHHGDTWLELERLFHHPEHVRPSALQLAARLADHRLDGICGPLVEGAFVALTVAEELGVGFTYAERYPHPENDELYPVEYRIPRGLREWLEGKRVAIVNDVINAGSAVRATFEDLETCGAEPIAIGALLVLGDWTASFAAEKGIAVEALAVRSSSLWTPAECPLCVAGVPLEKLTD